MSKISIVIPAYNADKYLAQTVDSVLAQTKCDWELIIVDDGSTDGTPALADGYAERDERIRIIHQRNGGLSAARNHGLREIDPSSRYVIFLDADDVWERDALGALQQALSANPRAVAAHGLMRCIDGQGHLSTPGRLERLASHRRALVDGHLTPWPIERPTTFPVLVVNNVIMTAGQVLIRHDVLNEVGLFDPTTSPAEDWDMWLRLGTKGDIALVDKVVLYYRRHDGNMSNQSKRMHQSRLRVYQKRFASHGLTDEQLQLVRLGYRWNRRINSRLFWSWACESAAQGQWIKAAKQVRHSLIEMTQAYIGAR